MELKQYIRNGLLRESTRYESILSYDGGSPKKIILVLEGRCRRKTKLGANRNLYENYYPVSFIGLEDCLVGCSRLGLVGAYPGTHYCLWEASDFMDAIWVYPDLARRAILELSRQIRIYYSQLQKTDLDLRSELGNIDVNVAETDISDILFSANFSSEDSFPTELVSKLKREYKAGEYVIRQGKKSFELYIILSGELEVRHLSDGKQKEIGVLKKGDLVGEMAQFDGLPRSADVLVRKDAELLVFLPENFSLLFQLHPKWSKKILSVLANRVEERRKDFENISLSTLVKKQP